MRTYIEGISLRLTVPRHLTLSFKFELSSVLMIIIYLDKKNPAVDYFAVQFAGAWRQTIHILSFIL